MKKRQIIEEKFLFGFSNIGICKMGEQWVLTGD
jgi:hypothetical protein